MKYYSVIIFDSLIIMAYASIISSENFKNSGSEDEFDRMKLGPDVKHINGLKVFNTRDPEPRIFGCSVPASKFENRFEWYFVWNNGSYILIRPEKSSWTEKKEDPDWYTDFVQIQFPSKNITHVACAGYTKYNQTSYNNTYEIEVEESVVPKILNGPQDNPLIYKPGQNLTCLGEGVPITFSWLQNGYAVGGLNWTDDISSVVTSTSTLTLDPKLADVQSNYTCIVTNFLGNDSYTFRVKQSEPPSPKTTPLAVVSFALVAVTLALVFVFACFHLKPRRFPKQNIQRFFNGVNNTEPTYTQITQDDEEIDIDAAAYDRSKEIKIKDLNFVKELKGGAFGKVEFGYYITNDGHQIPCAIKSMKDDDPNRSKEVMDYEFDCFLREIKIMQLLEEHRNVVKYLGAVTSDLAKYVAYIVVEFCSEGDLKSYLEDFKRGGGTFVDDIQDGNGLICSGNGYPCISLLTGSDSSGSSVSSWKGVVLKTSHLMKLSKDIAGGLEYISSKRVLHRDVALRNVLLACDGVYWNPNFHPDPRMLTAKISDFGLSKNLLEYPNKDYYSITVPQEAGSTRQVRLPLRWISPETLESLRFTTENDVWAFGVTLWELFTLGKTPYDELADSDDLRACLLCRLRSEEEILPQPDLASEEIWEIMQQCWDDSRERPDFKVLKERLQTINHNIRDEFNQKDSNSNKQEHQSYTAVALLTTQMGNISQSNWGFEDEYSQSDQYFEEDHQV